LLFVPQRFEGRDFGKSEISSHERRERGGVIGVLRRNRREPLHRCFAPFQKRLVKRPQSPG
jgi:hypothetical protein